MMQAFLLCSLGVRAVPCGSTILPAAVRAVCVPFIPVCSAMAPGGFEVRVQPCMCACDTAKAARSASGPQTLYQTLISMHPTHTQALCGSSDLFSSEQGLLLTLLCNIQHPHRICPGNSQTAGLGGRADSKRKHHATTGSKQTITLDPGEKMVLCDRL